MKTFTKALIIFVSLFFISSLMIQIFGTEFGNINFFNRHGWFFLICISFFPRLTLLFSSVPFGGFIWWLGFFFFPRILIACLATVTYFNTNPVLVVISWMIALGGEAAEKWGISRPKFHIRTFRHHHNEHPSEQKIQDNEAIDAEFTVKK